MSAEDALVVTVRADDLRVVLKCADYLEGRSLIGPVDRIADALALVQTRTDLAAEDAREAPNCPTCKDAGGDSSGPCWDCQGGTLYAREARLSEGEVERLVSLAMRAACDPGALLKRGDDYSEPLYDWQRRAMREALAPVVADMLTQRGREVVARVETACVYGLASTQDGRGVRSDHWRGQDYADGYDEGVERTTDLILRALGGTADGPSSGV